MKKMQRIVMLKLLRVAALSLAFIMPSELFVLAQDTFDTDKNGRYSDQYLDTVKVSKSKVINDYSMIGIQGGMGLNFTIWNPTKSQQMRIAPYNFGLFYTRYGKMFGMMPYFGFQAGVLFSQEGYKFKVDEEGKSPTLEGATEAKMDVIELPFYGQLHLDFWKMKFLANIGCFASYRLNINRIGTAVPEEIKTSFLPTDRRFDYGAKAGAGFAFIFDPFEIHFQAIYKQSLNNLFAPDYNSEYYYQWAFPANVQFSVGLHYHITNRLGKTTKVMKEEAREIIRTSRKKAKDEKQDSESR